MFNVLTFQTSGGSPDSNVTGNHVDTLTLMMPDGHDNCRGRVMVRRAL